MIYKAIQIGFIMAESNSRKFDSSEFDVFHEFIKTFKLMADETRMKIISLISKSEELNVSQLCKSLGQSQPAVSHHLALLRTSGFLEVRREGKHNFYSLSSSSINEITQIIKEYMKDESNQKDLVNFFKLMSDETRFRIVKLLSESGKLYSKQLSELLEQSQPAISHHLALLRTAEMIESHRDGEGLFYSFCRQKKIQAKILDFITQRMPNFSRALGKETAAPISLYFDLGEFSTEDVVEVIGTLSDLYRDIGGDALVIDGMMAIDFAGIAPEVV